MAAIEKVNEWATACQDEIVNGTNHPAVIAQSNLAVAQELLNLTAAVKELNETISDVASSFLARFA